MNGSVAGKLRTGITGLDDILGGGLPKDGLYLLQGHPGVGKTTLALQFLLEGVRNGEPALYITLSETAKEVQGIGAAHQWDMGRLAMYELSAVASKLERPVEQTMFH